MIKMLPIVCKMQKFNLQIQHLVQIKSGVTFVGGAVSVIFSLGILSAEIQSLTPGRQSQNQRGNTKFKV